MLAFNNMTLSLAFAIHFCLFLRFPYSPLDERRCGPSNTSRLRQESWTFWRNKSSRNSPTVAYGRKIRELGKRHFSVVGNDTGNFKSAIWRLPVGDACGLYRYELLPAWHHCNSNESFIFFLCMSPKHRKLLHYICHTLKKNFSLHLHLYYHLFCFVF